MFSKIVLVVLALAAPGQLLSNPEAQAKFQEAQDAFRAEDFEAAAAAVEAAYIIEPKPMLLYPWAQAERNQGNCGAAVALYQRFIDSGPREDLASAAQGNLDRCQEELDAAAAAEEQIIEDDDDEVVEEIVEDDEPDPAPIVVEPTTKDDGQPKTKVWYKDPLGGALTGAGVVGLGLGVGLLAVGSSTAKKASDEDTQTGYEDQRSRATSLRNGGAIAASIGGALVVGGVVRYLLVTRKGKESTAWRIAPELERRYTGVSVGRRF